MPANRRKRGSRPPTVQEARRKQVGAHILAGLTFRQIAERMGISLGLISRDWHIILDRYRTEQVGAVDAYIRLEQQRLDTALNGIWDKVVAGDVKSIEVFLKISERRARLLGLDAPTKVAPTDPTGEHSYEALTDDERAARIEALLAAARARRDRSAAADAS